MKFNSVIIGSDAYPKLTGQTPTQSSSTTTNNGLHIETGSGYIRVGPQNTSYCHMTTDRGQFYFNAKLIVNSGIISSYDEDLVLRRADNSSDQITVGTDQVTSTLSITAPGATLGDTGANAGVLNIYDTGNNSLRFEGTGSNAFRMDMLGTSAIGTLTMSDFDIHMSTGNFTRGQHHTGHLEGGHNNIGSTATKTSPIYTIGSSYNPNTDTLSNMYGIGYTHSDASFITGGGASGWGMYVAADGDSRVFLSGTYGHVVSTGEHFAGVGTEGTPGYTFTDDTDSGMYRSTTNEIGFSTGGTQRLNLSSRGVDVVNGDLELDGGAFVRKIQYSGTSNFNTSGSWFTLAYITEHNTPAYFALKMAAHSTITFVVTTAYHGSNVAHINVLSTTWTPNGGYPHPYQIRVLKDSSNNYRLQLKMQWSSLAGFTMDVRVWGAGHAKDVPSLQTSFTEDSTTGTEITAVTISRTGSSNSGSHSTRDGSATAPAYSFFNDTDTGMYRAGTDQVAFSAGGTQHLNVTNGSVDVGTTGGNTRLVLYKADNNTSDHLMFYLGSTRIGEIGCEDTSWLRINQETSKNIYTPRMFRADGGLQTKSGSASSPGLAFQADTDTGIYRVDANQLGITAGGTLRATFDSTGITLPQQIKGGFGAVTTSGTTDWNHVTNARSGMGYTLLLGTHTNGPGSSNYLHPVSFEYNSKDGSGNMTQFAIPYTGTNGPYFRSRYSNSWSGWYEIYHTGNHSALAKTSATTNINMNNFAISNLNNLTFNDPGANEGIKWNGGTLWQIYESPDDQTNASGNLQFTSGSGSGTRRLTLSTTKLTVGSGVGLDLTTGSGNVRGLFLASETGPHLRISTSSGEQIGFYDGGTSGTLNVVIQGSGDLDLKTGSLDINGTTVISTGRALQNITGLDMMATTTADVDLNRSGWITFYGNGAQHHAIGSRNNVGSADDDIRINSYGAVWVNLDSNGNDSNSNHSSFFIGKHGQATNTIINLFKVDGETADVTTSGNVTAYGSPSDIRLKENIEVIPNAVEKVQKLEGITFTYKKDGKRSTGLIAQQLQEVLPEVVYEAEDVQTEEKHLAVRYGNVVGLLVEALKEQQTQIDNLTTLVNQLKEK